MSDPTGYPRYEQVQSDTLTELLEIRDSVTAGRHPKWQRVEPGTVIPAGQPYRVEYSRDAYLSAQEYRTGSEWRVPVGVTNGWFVDSSWKPPLVLPTEPTWGIAVVIEYNRGVRSIEWLTDVCVKDRNGDLTGRYTACVYEPEHVVDFIEFTDEQIARIEAAR